ncbi:MAG: hypothetical protein SOY45_08100 [Lachnospiraceae bacterium]|nr:hypothetical protein [Lachnospiraceae bacterium]MDY4069825.1 hypothetical protein [Lachnospiraceae bacterium]
MDNQKIMQNKQPVVIQRTSEETDTVQKAGAQFKTDQQKAAEQQNHQKKQKNFIQEFSDYEEFILGAENLIDTDSVEIREEKKESIQAAQDSASFRNMSAEAEQRKEYLKNGQQMPEDMQKKYKEEFHQAKKEEAEQEEHQEEEMSQTQLSAENVEAEISRLISLLKDVRDGMNADTGSASESFRAMRDAMNQFSEVLNSGKDTDAIMESHIALRHAAQVYLNTHSGRRRFTSRGSRRKGYAETILEELNDTDETLAREYNSYKMAQLEERKITEADTHRAENMHQQIFGEEEYTPYSEEEASEINKNGTLEERLKVHFSIWFSQHMGHKFAQSLAKYGYGFNTDVHRRMINESTNALLGNQTEKAKVVTMLMELLQLGDRQLTEAYDGFAAEQAPEGMDQENYAYTKLMNCPSAIRHMRVTNVIGRTGGIDEMFMYRGMNLRQHFYTEEYNRKLDALQTNGQDGFDYQERYDQIKKAGLHYVELNKDALMDQFRQLLRSGMLVKSETGEPCTQDDLNMLDALAEEIVADKMNAELREANK